jgi:hypothetical protein
VFLWASVAVMQMLVSDRERGVVSPLLLLLLLLLLCVGTHYTLLIGSDTVNLREHPKAQTTKSLWKHKRWPWVMTKKGYGKNV